MEALTELVTIGIGKAAASLSSMVGRRVELKIPHLRIVGSELTGAINVTDQEQVSAIAQGFTGGFNGVAASMITSPSVRPWSACCWRRRKGLERFRTRSGAGPSPDRVGNILINGLMARCRTSSNTTSTTNCPAT